MLKVFLLLSGVIALVVVIHYEFLYRFTIIMPRLKPASNPWSARSSSPGPRPSSTSR